MIKFKSKTYNHTFDPKTGYFEYWGKTKEDNPDLCPYGPTILDIEISSGKCIGCEFCYKSNGPSKESSNMSFELFTKIFDKLDRMVLTQIAFGLTTIDANPEMWSIFAYCRKHRIIPNYTCNGFNITEEVAKKTAAMCGAVAVSIIDKETSYGAIKTFISAGMAYINIHFLLCEETFNQSFMIMDDMKKDPRLAGLNALVFLQYKPKTGKSEKFTPIQSVEKYQKLVGYAEENKINIGFDSCSAPLYLKSIEKSPEFKKLSMFAEPCESGLFSAYINFKGEFFPCSFSEGIGNWSEGINILDYDSFYDIWDHTRVKEWRENLLKSSKNCKCDCQTVCRSCPIYEITPCKV